MTKKNLFIVSIISFLPLSIILGNLIFQILIIFIIISSLLFLLSSKNKYNFFDDKKEIIIFLIIILYLGINTMVSEDWTRSIRRNFFYFQFFLLVLSLRYMLINPIILKRVIFNWFIIICFVSFDIFFESYFGFNMLGFSNETGYTGRVVSFFKDELIVGSFILSFLIPIFSYFYINNKFKLSLFFIFLSLFSIFLSGERASSIKILLALSIIFLFWNYRNYLKKYILSILIILTLIISFNPFFKESNFVQHNLIHKYFTTTLKILSTDTEKTIRENLIDSRYLNQAVFSYEIFKQNPYFGVGNKNYLLACGKYANDYDPNLCFTHAHQTYYELIAEHGLVGSTLMVSALFFLIFFNKTNNLNINNKKKLIIFRIFLILSFLPLIPSGSFFSSYMSSLFWINYCFYTIYRNQLINYQQLKN